MRRYTMCNGLRYVLTCYCACDLHPATICPWQYMPRHAACAITQYSPAQYAPSLNTHQSVIRTSARYIHDRDMHCHAVCTGRWYGPACDMGPCTIDTTAVIQRSCYTNPPTCAGTEVQAVLQKGAGMQFLTAALRWCRSFPAPVNGCCGFDPRRNDTERCE